jgi:hypothetical protein
MRVVLRLVHPSNIDVEIELLDAEVKTLDALISTLLAKGYRPRAGAWPTGPSGNPLCLRHGGIEMQAREKQGDTWYSHKVTSAHGEELYCRGYRHGEAASDGFLHAQP